jgi:hypothetical protein
MRPVPGPSLQKNHTHVPSPWFKLTHHGYHAPHHSDLFTQLPGTCFPWPTSWAVWDRDNTAVNRVAPFETWGNAWFNAPCLYWPAPAQRPVRVASDGSGHAIRSALLIDETLDAATPFEGSLEVRKLFPHSVLLAEPGGTTHADSLSGNLCVDGTIASYLETGKLPPRHPGAKWDITCHPLPVPDPTAKSAGSASSAAVTAR